MRFLCSVEGGLRILLPGFHRRKPFDAVPAYEIEAGGVLVHMDLTLSTWIWVAGLGGAGGVASAWLTRQRGAPAALGGRNSEAIPGIRLGRFSHLAVAAAIAAGTAAATAWMIASTDAPTLWIGTRAFPAALAFFWIGFVTAGWMAAERDKQLLRQAVYRAATAPAAHPDTVRALANASPDAVYEAVKALVPRRVVH